LPSNCVPHHIDTTISTLTYLRGLRARNSSIANNAACVCTCSARKNATFATPKSLARRRLSPPSVIVGKRLLSNENYENSNKTPTVQAQTRKNTIVRYAL
jgi:hypothetical protein